MPPVTAFKRRWACGTDDFVFPGFIDSSVKTGWLISSLVTFIFKKSVIQNNNSFPFLDAYIYGMMASLLIIIIFDLIIMKKSGSGGIMDSEKRKNVVSLIYLRLFWEILDTGWNAFGTYSIITGKFSRLLIDDPGSYFFIRRYVICNWISVVILILFFAFFFDPLGGFNEKFTQEYEDAQTTFWGNKLRTYMKFLNFKMCDVNPEIFKNVGRNAAFLFKNSSLVSSDILSGLFLLSELDDLQLEQINNDKKYCVRSEESTNSGHILAHASSDEIQSILTNLKFGCSKKWRQFMNNSHKRLMNFDKIMSNTFVPSTSNNANNQFKKLINCFRLNSFGCLPEESEDIQVLHLSFTKDYEMLPYMVFLNHKTESFYVNIFGSLSSKTILNYLDSLPSSFHDPKIPSSYKVHQGLLKTCKNLTSSMETAGIFNTFKNNYSSYKLVIIGHNFGGGVAAILGTYLYSSYPDLKVISINPPGGIFSEECASSSKKFVTSIIFGNDVFSSISFASILKLRQEIESVIQSSSAPKYKLLIGLLLKLLGMNIKIKLMIKEQATDKKMHKICAINQAFPLSMSSEDVSINTNVDSIFQEETALPNLMNNLTTPMFLPGNILHVQINSSKGRDSKCCHWKEPVECTNIKLSRKGILSHFNSIDQVKTGIESAKETPNK